MSILNEGDLAPDFSAANAKGKEMQLSALKGKNVVLYFYPKDDTPGCTIEAKEFTEAAAQFANAGALVLGVSYDDAVCHQAFIDKYALNIELICDTSRKIAEAYGCAGEKYPNRDTFLINKDGKIAKIWRAVKPQGHAAAVLAAIS